MVIFVLVDQMKKIALLFFGLFGFGMCNTASAQILYFPISSAAIQDYETLSISNGPLKLKERRICKVPENEYLSVNNCRPGDVVLIQAGSLHKILEVCKLDDPIITYKGSFACTYEDHETLFYTPRKIEKELPRITGRKLDENQ